MAARDAVLNTCELLEHIISYLPPHQIAPASRVCKTWKTLIDDSAKISRARCCLVPIRESPRGPGRPYTVYARDSDILFHVGLGGEDKCRFSERANGDGPGRLTLLERRKFGFEITRESNYLERLDAGEFLTSPPVQSLHVGLGFCTPELGGATWDREVRAVGGVRVGDLLTVAAEVTEQMQRMEDWGAVKSVAGWYCVEVGEMLEG